jgi:phage/plasmid-associated DNA primase
MDRGVRRRLLVIGCNRVIPEVERIEGLGRRIVAEEGDQLLAFVVAGASRLIARRRFPALASSDATLREWMCAADPVLGFLLDDEAIEITGQVSDVIDKQELYRMFQAWCRAGGMTEWQMVKRQAFSLRVKNSGMPGLQERRIARARQFQGLRRAKPQRNSDGDAPVTPG